MSEAMLRVRSGERSFVSAGSSGNYRPDIDGLRAVAVCAVIVNHFNRDWLPGGFLGVDIFFVISGYVITTSLAEHPHADLQAMLLRFYARRMKRLLPALATCVIITSIIGALLIYPSASEYKSSMKAGEKALLGLSNWYFYAEATDYFGSLSQLNLFMHTWSLGVEEQFYFVFPLLFWYGNRRSHAQGRSLPLVAMLSILTLTSFIIYIAFNVSEFAGAYFLTPCRFWELGAGCLIALASQHSNQAKGDGGRAWAAWLASGLVLLALFAPEDRQSTTTPVVVGAATVLIMTLRPAHPIYRLLTLRAVVTVGLISYSLYLWHWSVLCLSHWTIGIHWWSVPIQLAVIFALAALSYVFIERPLRRAEWAPSNWKTIQRGLLITACSIGVVVIFKSGHGKVLYTGAPAEMAAKGVHTLRDDKWFSGVLEWRARECILASNEEVGKRIDAETCTLKANPASARRKFLVVGNSFSAAEFEMYSVLSEQGLGSVIATSSWAAPPVREIRIPSPYGKVNDYYWDSVVPSLLARLQAGDFLIMINDMSGLAPAAMSLENREMLSTLQKGLMLLASELRQKGVGIIFQAANPLMREALCTPDMARPQWFHVFGRTRCVYHSRSETLRRIKPLSDVLAQVQASSPNFYILDLFPVMCPDAVCRFYDNAGVMLYRDIFSHPSIEANYLARSSLLSIVDQALRHSQDGASVKE